MASWGTCYGSACAGASNPIHPDFPPLMSDSRNFTNWNPACAINENLRRQYGISSNHEYRQFLMANADKLIEQNQREACNQCGACERQFSQPPIDEKQTYLYQTCHDSQMPYGYESSDLKSVYLSRQQLQAQMHAPIMTQAEYYFKRLGGQ